MYFLRRLSDEAGDCGSMSLAIFPDGRHEHDARPRIGVQLRVGSLYGRTFAAQDWWQTTFITEIVRDEPNQVEFATDDGARYVWQID